MKIFIAGLSGATGCLVASQLLAEGHEVVGFVRTPSALAASVSGHPKARIYQGSLLAIPSYKLKAVLDSAEAIVSCLGHNISFKGIWGQPRTLVSEALRRLVELTQHRPMRLVLMSSNAVVNTDNNERLAWFERGVITVLRKALPPHNDNERAAAFLHNEAPQNLQWVIVRPDTLVNDGEVTPYASYNTLQRGVIFGAGQTSRINVAHFICELLTNAASWQRWQGQWPVIYNCASEVAVPSSEGSNA